jgi:hypothetical protein
MVPFRIGFRVCDRRFPFLWSGPGQRGGRWNREGEAPIHYLASSPLVAWAEWLRHQEIEEPEDLRGVAASLWAVLIPSEWIADGLLPTTDLSLDAVMATTEQAQDARLACVQRFRQQGAVGLRAPTAALLDPALPPCWRCREGEEKVEALPESAEVLVLWCDAAVLAGWPCVRAGAPSAEVLPYVRLSDCLSR